MAKKRTNVIPIIEDARHPAKYRMLVGMVDVIFSDVAQPDQVWFNFFHHIRRDWFQPHIYSLYILVFHNIDVVKSVVAYYYCLFDFDSSLVHLVIKYWLVIYLL